MLPSLLLGLALAADPASAEPAPSESPADAGGATGSTASASTPSGAPTPSTSAPSAPSTSAPSAPSTSAPSAPPTPAPATTDTPAPPAPDTAAQAAPVPTGSAPPPLGARVAGEEIDVPEAQEVLRKRAELYEALVEEGYARRRRQGDDRTVFLSEDPWKPQVVVHDDGWVYFRRQPPRIHAPGKSFADQGSPAAYLLCIIAPTSCVSVGGWLVSNRKLSSVQGDVLGSTQEKIRAMNDAVARRELGRRLNEDIPRDLEVVWARAELPAGQRKALLFEYWDSRTDTPEGDAAKAAVESFLRGVVQQSDTPYTPEELAALNAKRQSVHPLVLTPRGEAP